MTFFDDPPPTYEEEEARSRCCKIPEVKTAYRIVYENGWTELKEVAPGEKIMLGIQAQSGWVKVNNITEIKYS